MSLVELPMDDDTPYEVEYPRLSPEEVEKFRMSLDQLCREYEMNKQRKAEYGETTRML